MNERPISLSLQLVIGTVMAGLAIRFAPLGLPVFVRKYGGSCFWALVIYWLISTVRPSLRVVSVVAASGLIATAVEFFKLYRSPAVDVFRQTIPGVLLLGKYFSVWDIVAYWIAIAAGGLLDRALRSHTSNEAVRPNWRSSH